MFALLIGALVFVGVYSVIFHDESGDWHTHQRLARSGLQVTGAVTAKEPMNHASIRYDYYVDGIRYSGGPCAAGDLDRIHLGDSVAVTYLPDSPSISVCGDAQAAYKNRSGQLFIVAPLFALLGALGMGFGVYYRYMRRQPRTSSNHAMQPTADRHV
jgi:hypothetical protein